MSNTYLGEERLRLYEFKAKYMSKLSLYSPENEREEKLKHLLVNKLNYLRAMNLPNLIHTLYLIIEHENVSDKFKEICREMLKSIEKLDFSEQ